MKTDEEAAVASPEKIPYGKVMGIVEHRDQLRAITEALTTLGLREVQVLDGFAGAGLLDREHAAASHCFLGDMEAPMVQRYLDAVKNGWIAFAAVVEPETAEEASKTAKSLGALEVVHFGTWVITNY